MTTGYTRIRVPIIVRKATGVLENLTEKLVLLTSADRTMVAALGSRQVTLESTLDDMFAHNTPLVVHFQPNQRGPSIALQIHSSNHPVLTHQIVYNGTLNKYIIPPQIDVKSSQFLPLEFDAPVPKKKK